jgi:hypothetical protein
MVPPDFEVQLAWPQGQFVAVPPAVSSHLVLQYLLSLAALQLQAGCAHFCWFFGIFPPIVRQVDSTGKNYPIYRFLRAVDVPPDALRPGR